MFAVLLAVYDGFFSTGVSTSGSCLSSPSPTIATFLITPPLSISVCVTVYVPFTVALSPTATSTVVFTPIISSTTGTSSNVVFPVFVTVIVYSIVSPAVVTLSLFAVLFVVYDGLASSTLVSTLDSSFSPSLYSIFPIFTISF